ncbi:hypothetical protein EON65_09815 [archaeon]|nr:MAG: hypothetical protein EON65_09815 [archaeon]
MEELKALLNECEQSHVYEITGCFVNMEEAPSHPVVQQVRIARNTSFSILMVEYPLTFGLILNVSS